MGVWWLIIVFRELRGDMINAERENGCELATSIFGRQSRCYPHTFKNCPFHPECFKERKEFASEKQDRMIAMAIERVSKILLYKSKT